MRREERIAGRERGTAYTYFVRHQATSALRYHSLTLHDEQANATIESRILPWDNPDKATDEFSLEGILCSHTSEAFS